MKLLLVIESLEPGGAETSLVALAPELVRRGFAVEFLVLSNQPGLSHILESHGVPIHRAPLETGRLRCFFAVRRVIATTSPDLVHTTLYWSDQLGRVAAWSLGVPVVSSWVNDSHGEHHDEVGRASAFKLLLTQLIDMTTSRLVTSFHSITDSISASATRRLRIRTTPVRTIPRGRDPIKFAQRAAVERDDVRTKLGFSSSERVVLSVARLDPQKDHETLIRSFAILRTRVDEVVLVIAGKPGRASARVHAAAAAAGGDIRFLGHRTDVRELLVAADVMVLSSVREGLGGVLIEAMAVGCPIVASAIGPIDEVLGTEGSPAGITVQPKDDGAFASAVERVLTQPALATQLSVTGRQVFERRFTLPSVADQMAEFYRGALEHHLRGARPPQGLASTDDSRLTGR